MTLGLSIWKWLLIILYFPTLNVHISQLFGRDSFELALTFIRGNSEISVGALQFAAEQQLTHFCLGQCVFGYKIIILYKILAGGQMDVFFLLWVTSLSWERYTICTALFNLHFVKNEGLWPIILIWFIFTISLNKFQPTWYQNKNISFGQRLPCDLIVREDVDFPHHFLISQKLN